MSNDESKDSTTDELPKDRGKTTLRLSLFNCTPGSIKTLRRFYKKSARIPEVEELKSELLGESDRTAIIVMATLLDDVLAYRLEKSLCFHPEESEVEHIFRFEGPLGTFSSRTEIACLFGFIDDVTYQQLDIVRELRNACAHSIHPTVFSDAALVNVVRRMLHPLGFVGCESNRSKTLKKAFIVESFILYATLFHGSREIGLKTISEQLPAADIAPSRHKPTER